MGKAQYGLMTTKSLCSYIMYSITQFDSMSLIKYRQLNTFSSCEQPQRTLILLLGCCRLIEIKYDFGNSLYE